MPRPLRAFEPNISLHVIHRGHNGAAMFCDDTDFELFLLFLKRGSRHYGVRIHGFALMSNHYHLVVTPDDKDALARMMKSANARYVRHFNRKYQRFGTLLSGRFRAEPLRDERYWITCLRYVDLNPLRARMVRQPEDYRWCSYRTHALGVGYDWLDEHPLYQELGLDAAARQANYRIICRTPLTEADLTLLKFHVESVA
jgi:putative transposase